MCAGIQEDVSAGEEAPESTEGDLRGTAAEGNVFCWFSMTEERFYKVTWSVCESELY